MFLDFRQYIGDPIDCIVEEIPNNVMDTYCWIHSTFSVTGAHKGIAGRDFAHSGVAPPPGINGEDEGIKYHKYYQWVCFTLFFQALLFYIPRYNKYRTHLEQDLNKCSFLQVYVEELGRRQD